MDKKLEAITFEQCAQDDISKIYADWVDGEYRGLVLRGPGSVNAYIGIRSDHPLYGMDYDDIPIDCHGGLTFAREGNGDIWPSGYWWYGWDYSHAGDAVFYDISRGFDTYGDEKWTPYRVQKEANWVIHELQRLTELIHTCINNARTAK